MADTQLNRIYALKSTGLAQLLADIGAASTAFDTLGKAKTAALNATANGGSAADIGRITKAIEEQTKVQLESLDNLKKMTATQNEFVGSVNKVNEAQKGVKISMQESAASMSGDLTNAAHGIMQVQTQMLNFRNASASTDDFLKQFSGTMQENVRLFVQYSNRLKEIKAELKEIEKETEKYGLTQDDVSAKVERLVSEQNLMQTALAETKVAIKAENKERIAASGSIDEMAQRLGRLRDTYRQLGEAERNSAEGQAVLRQINAIDAAVKEADASIGNFQRNVGNYPNAKKELSEIHQQLAQLILDGKQGTAEFDKVVARGHEVRNAITAANGTMGGSTFGSMTSGSPTFSGVSQELSQVTRQMHSLVLEEKQGTEEFAHLVARAHELKAAMNDVKMAVDKNTESVGGIGNSLKNLAGQAVALASTYLGFQALQQIASDIVEELGQADKNAAELKNTLTQYNNVQAFSRLANQADELAGKLQYLDNDSVIKVFDNLLTYGKLTEKQMKELTPVIVDFAAKEGIGIEEASEKIIMSLEGNAKALKKYGVNIKDAADETEKAASPAERLSLIMKELKPRVEGAAETFTTTLPGKIAILKQSFADIEESIGHFLVKLSGVDAEQQKLAVSSKKEAESAQLLVDEYTMLSGKVGQTEDDKKRLDSITNTLAADFGNSVVEINKETGALTLNIEATKDLIKQKILLSNQRASELALKFNASEETRKKALEEATVAQKLYDAAVQETGITEERVNAKLFNGDVTRDVSSLSPAEQRIVKLSDALNKYKGVARDAGEESAGLAKSLKELGFSEGDVAKLFNPNTPITPKAGGDEAKVKTTSSIDAELAARKALADALLFYQKQQLQIDAEHQKTIMDNTKVSLQERIEAYQKYYADLNKMAALERDAAISNEIAKAVSNEKKIAQSGKNGNPVLSKGEKSALEMEIQASDIRVKGLIEKNSADNLRLLREKEDKRLDIIKSSLEDEYKIGESAYQDKKNHEAQLFLNDLQALRQLHSDKEITTKEYQERVANLQQVFNLASEQEDIRHYQALLASDKLTADERVEVAKKLGAALLKEANDTKPVDSKKTDRDKALKVQAVNAAIDLEHTITTELLHQQELRDAAIERSAQKNLDWTKRKVGAQVQSLKEQQANELVFARAQEQLERDKAERAKKRAMAQMAIEYATAALKIVAANVAGLPFTAGQMILEEGVLAATYATKLGFLSAANAYATGTDYHPGGVAIVGDGGQPELVQVGNQYYVSPSTPTAINMPAGSKVTPFSNIPDISAAGNFSYPGAQLRAPVMSPSYFAGSSTTQGAGQDFSAISEAFGHIYNTMGTVMQGVQNIQVGLDTHKLGGALYNNSFKRLRI